MGDLLKVGYYVLLLLPGFLFVQVSEYHLLREEKPQFEKALEIILYSALIWLLAVMFPIPNGWLGQQARASCLDAILHTVNDPKGLAPIHWSRCLLSSFGTVFLTVSGLSVVSSAVWGWVRKTRPVDSFIRRLTGRDWWPSVSFQFFQKSIGKAIIVKVGDIRYMGMLECAPDTKGDKHIYITQPAVLPDDGSAVPLPLVKAMLVNINELQFVQAVELPRTDDSAK